MRCESWSRSFGLAADIPLIWPSFSMPMNIVPSPELAKAATVCRICSTEPSLPKEMPRLNSMLSPSPSLRGCHRWLRSHVEEPHQSFQVLCPGSWVLLTRELDSSLVPRTEPPLSIACVGLDFPRIFCPALTDDFGGRRRPGHPYPWKTLGYRSFRRSERETATYHLLT